METLKPSDASVHPGLNERRLRYFATAVVVGSIRGAADRLDIEPSVLSRQIQQFEAELGITLLERRGRGVKPTEAALLVIEHYRECLIREETLFVRLEELNGLQRGRIHIVASEGFVDALFNTVLTGFCREYPNIHITLELLNVNEIVDAVVEDRAHLGLAYAATTHPDARPVLAKRQPLVAVMAPHHPLASQVAPLALQDLAAYAIGMAPTGFGLRNLVQMAEFSEKIKFTPGFTSTSIAALRHYAASGLGVTLMPEIAAAREIAAGQLVAIHTRNRLFENAEAQLLIRDKRPRAAAMSRLLARMAATNGLWADPGPRMRRP